MKRTEMLSQALFNQTGCNTGTGDDERDPFMETV